MNQMKKRKAVAGVVCLCIMLLVLGVVFWFGKQKEESGGNLPGEDALTWDNKVIAEQQIEKVQDMELPEQNDWMEREPDKKENQKIEDDLRIHGFPYIKLTNQLKTGDYVDVRISFANGGDFVLLSKKQIQGIGPLREEGTNALWLVVSEEEILRLSSAVVDAYLNEGCSIYAIQYVADTQKEAVVNYVVSDTVKQLMEANPNIVKRAENVQEYALWKEYQTGIQREEVYPEQDEIIYVD